jgi:predicted nucleic acid-binding protein
LCARTASANFGEGHITTPIDSSSPETAVRFASRVRSDQLGDLARLLSRIEPFRNSTSVVQATVILDANVVIADLIWLCGRRKKSDARSTLLELLECATVKAYAPTFLAVEVENHFPQLQKEQGIDPAHARQEWNRFVPRITFIDVGGPDASYAGVTDPKDVPYALLQKRLPVPIVSEDPHLAKMGASVIRIQIFSPLRSYSRQRAVEYQIKVAGIGAVFAAGLAAKLTVDGARAATRVIASIPKPVLAIGAVGLIAALVHPPSRKWIFERLEKAADLAGAAAGGIYELLQPVLEEHSTAKQSADDFLVAVTALLSDAGIAPADVLRKPDEPVKLKRTRKRSTGAERIRKRRSNETPGNVRGRRKLR